MDKVCAWVVKTEPGDKVVLTFETFALEDNPVCQYDYVIVRDGSTPYACISKSHKIVVVASGSFKASSFTEKRRCE